VVFGTSAVLLIDLECFAYAQAINLTLVENGGNVSAQVKKTMPRKSARHPAVRICFFFKQPVDLWQSFWVDSYC